jgi:thiol-disulfide isomerase/thioredoxin
MYYILKQLKSVIPFAIIVGTLYATGILGTVISFGQSAILKTGVFNAGDESEALEEFDYSFKIKSLDGKVLNTDSLRNKVVFLNLWATWCGPCRTEMPTIQNLYSNLNSRDVVFVILSIDRKSQESKVREYIAKNKFTFPVYVLDGQLTAQLNVPSIPTTFIVSKNGVVIRKEVGMTNFNTEKFRKFLLKESGK